MSFSFKTTCLLGGFIFCYKNNYNKVSIFNGKSIYFFLPATLHNKESTVPVLSYYPAASGIFSIKRRILSSDRSRERGCIDDTDPRPLCVKGAVSEADWGIVIRNNKNSLPVILTRLIKRKNHLFNIFETICLL
jgi:hypothetical protein